MKPFMTPNQIEGALGCLGFARRSRAWPGGGGQTSCEQIVRQTERAFRLFVMGSLLVGGLVLLAMARNWGL
jgi:hypothetical protein